MLVFIYSNLSNDILHPIERKNTLSGICDQDFGMHGI